MMNEIERIYQRRRRLLICAFICSILLFMVFTFIPILSWQLHLGWVFILLKIAGVLGLVLLLFLFIRYVLFRAATLKDPVLRKAVDDERIKRSWLEAYRTALFVMAGIHFMFLLPIIGPTIEGIGFPHVAWTSSTTGLVTLFGAAVYFSREM